MTLPALNTPVTAFGQPGYVVARSWGTTIAPPAVTVEFSDGTRETLSPDQINTGAARATHGLAPDGIRKGPPESLRPAGPPGTTTKRETAQ